MKNLNWTYITTALILASGIVGYGLINYNQTKLVTQGEQAKKVVEVVTPTFKPTPTVTPTPTAIYKTTTQAQPTLNAEEIGKEIKAMYPNNQLYASLSDEELGEDYIARHGNTPLSEVHPQVQLPVQTNTNCATMGSFTNCTSTSF